MSCDNPLSVSVSVFSQRNLTTCLKEKEAKRGQRGEAEEEEEEEAIKATKGHTKRHQRDIW